MRIKLAGFAAFCLWLAIGFIAFSSVGDPRDCTEPVITVAMTAKSYGAVTVFCFTFFLLGWLTGEEV